MKLVCFSKMNFSFSTLFRGSDLMDGVPVDPHQSDANSDLAERLPVSKNNHLFLIVNWSSQQSEIIARPWLWRDFGLSMAFSMIASKIWSLIFFMQVESDFLMAYSVVPGYFSWRNSIRGSWFVQALCDCLDKYGRSMDLLRLMTRVNKKVALDFESNTSNKYKEDLRVLVNYFQSIHDMSLDLNDSPIS